jgi:hypothetical protein
VYGPDAQTLYRAAANGSLDAHAVSTAEAAAPSSTSQVSADTPAYDPRRFLVRTGDMSVIVAKGGVPEAAAHVTSLTAGYGGYVLTSQVSTGANGARPFADITVRIPARSYDQAIARFGQLGTVHGVQTAADDVTGQFVDLRARLAQQRRVEQRLLGFLARATNVSEALAVQSRITATELSIEELTGQLKTLHEQVSYGTLAVSLTEKAGKPVPPAHHSSFVAALLASWHRLVAGFEAILVGLGAVIPFAVLFVALVFAGLWAARAARRLRGKAPLAQ